MRRLAGLIVAAIGLLALPGCQYYRLSFNIWRTALGSVYNAYGDGYSADRMVKFNDRYDEQTQEAAEYYREHPEDGESTLTPALSPAEREQGTVALLPPEGDSSPSIVR
jgi:hypothetical protein